MMTPITEDNVDGIVAAIKARAMEMHEQSEERFVDSVTARGALTVSQAYQVLDDERAAVLEQLDAQMLRLRGWLLRGCTDLQ